MHGQGTYDKVSWIRSSVYLFFPNLDFALCGPGASKGLQECEWKYSLFSDFLMPLDETNDIETCSNREKNIVCQMEICLYAMNFSLKDLTFQLMFMLEYLIDHAGFL